MWIICPVLVQTLDKNISTTMVINKKRMSDYMESQIFVDVKVKKRFEIYFTIIPTHTHQIYQTSQKKITEGVVIALRRSYKVFVMYIFCTYKKTSSNVPKWPILFIIRYTVLYTLYVYVYVFNSRYYKIVGRIAITGPLLKNRTTVLLIGILKKRAYARRCAYSLLTSHPGTVSPQ